MTIAAVLAPILMSAPQKTESLLNGKDLSGWHMDVPDLDKNPGGTKPFFVKNAMLEDLGKPGGHLITDKSFKNYRLVAEYRFTGEPGNGGILVHASVPRRLYGMFPQSIEVQLQSGDAGDFWCIGEDIVVPDMEKRRGPKDKWGVDGDKARRILNLTDGAEKPVGEWNTIKIECRERTVKVWVNGDLVNEGHDATADHGQIAIQAEGSPMEFRRFDVSPL